MKFETVTTVYDDGAAALARDALAEQDIQVRLHRRGPDHPYVGLFAKEQIEVQVPEDQVAAAREALAWLERDAELAALEQGGSSSDEDEDEGEGAAPEPPRPRRVSTALALAVLVPIPVACLYAGSRRLGQLLLGLGVGVFVLALGSGQGEAGLRLLMAVKIVDVLLALPRLLRR